MPLLQDFSERILRRFGGPSKIPPEVSTMMGENLAHALSYLEQAKPWLTEADNLRHRALFLEFSSVIAQDLEETVADAARSRAQSRPAWLLALIRYWHQHRCSVLTLNYDTLIETFVSEVILDDGRTLLPQHIYPPLLTDAAFRAGAANSPPPIPSFRLLKLHGSTNWYYSGRSAPQGEPIYFVPPPSHETADTAVDDHRHRLRAVSDKYPFLIPPIYDKSSLFTHETIRALWFEAGEALQQAREVICMGYSLPESDLTMKHFLRTTLPHGVSIEVVDPSKQALKNFETFLGAAKLNLRQSYSGDRSIQRFVEERAALRRESS